MDKRGIGIRLLIVVVAVAAVTGTAGSWSFIKRQPATPKEVVTPKASARLVGTISGPGIHG